jgi:hypothetical protein
MNLLVFRGDCTLDTCVGIERDHQNPRKLDASSDFGVHEGVRCIIGNDACADQSGGHAVHGRLAGTPLKTPNGGGT